MSSGGDPIVTQPRLNITQRSNSHEAGLSDEADDFTHTGITSALS